MSSRFGGGGALRKKGLSGSCSQGEPIGCVLFDSLKFVFAGLLICNENHNGFEGAYPADEYTKATAPENAGSRFVRVFIAPSWASASVRSAQRRPRCYVRYLAQGAKVMSETAVEAGDWLCSSFVYRSKWFQSWSRAPLSNGPKSYLWSGAYGPFCGRAEAPAKVHDTRPQFVTLTRSSPSSTVGDCGREPVRGAVWAIHALGATPGNGFREAAVDPWRQFS